MASGPKITGAEGFKNRVAHADRAKTCCEKVVGQANITALRLISEALTVAQESTWKARDVAVASLPVLAPGVVKAPELIKIFQPPPNLPPNVIRFPRVIQITPGVLALGAVYGFKLSVDMLNSLASQTAVLNALRLASDIIDQSFRSQDGREKCAECVREAMLRQDSEFVRDTSLGWKRERKSNIIPFPGLNQEAGQPER